MANSNKNNTSKNPTRPLSYICLLRMARINKTGPTVQHQPRTEEEEDLLRAVGAEVSKVTLLVPRAVVPFKAEAYIVGHAARLDFGFAFDK